MEAAHCLKTCNRQKWGTDRGEYRVHPGMKIKILFNSMEIIYHKKTQFITWPMLLAEQAKCFMLQLNYTTLNGLN